MIVDSQGRFPYYEPPADPSTVDPDLSGAQVPATPSISNNHWVGERSLANQVVLITYDSLSECVVNLNNEGYIYTNMDELFIPGVRHFDIKHLGDFVPEADSLLLLDEVGMIWDNRDYKTFRPEVRDFFKLQRHYHVTVYMASQTFDVDKKLRDLCDGMFLHSNFLRVFTLGRRITRQVVITESTSEAESRISEDLKILAYTLIWVLRPQSALFATRLRLLRIMPTSRKQ